MFVRDPFLGALLGTFLSVILAVQKQHEPYLSCSREFFSSLRRKPGKKEEKWFHHREIVALVLAFVSICMASFPPLRNSSDSLSSAV